MSIECFAIMPGMQCRALDVLICKGENCAFRKTEEQLAGERKASIERRKMLGMYVDNEAPGAYVTTKKKINPKKLKEILHEREITVTEITRNARLGTHTLGKIMQGNECFPATIEKIAGVLGVMPEEITA